MSRITITITEYLELLDFKLNALRVKFDSGKPWEMEEALAEAKRLNHEGYRDDVIAQMENDLKADQMFRSEFSREVKVQGIV